MFSVIGKFLLQFTEPLAIVGLFLFIALLIVGKKAKGSLFFLIVALLLVAVLGNTFFSSWISRSMEWRYMPVDVNTVKADAIVLLADGTKAANTPRLRVELGEEADRALYATAMFQRGAAKGILVVGGPEESESTRQFLIELGVPQELVFLNQDTKDIVETVTSTTVALQNVGAKSMILVTSALEMDRMRFAFEQGGLEVIPAPCDYQITKNSWDEMTAFDLKSILIQLMPNSDSFEQSVRVLREYFSFAFYRIRAIL